MLYIKQILLLLMCLGFLHGEIVSQRNSEFDDEILSLILKYLGEHNSFYSFKRGRVLQSFVKDDKLEVTSEVEITCDHPCTGGTLRCDSILRYPSYGTSLTVAGTVCAPQEPYFEGIKYLPSLEEKKETNYPTIVHHVTSEVDKIPLVPSLSSKDDENTESRVPCLGCPSDIDPNAENVNKLVDAAIRHVESEHNEKHALLKVLKVQQQVVAGIKYTLLIEIAPTVCQKDADLLSCPLDQNRKSFVCEVQFWEKPWQSSSLIVKNNCTTSQEYILQEPINTTKKPVHRETEPDFMTDLESQIIPMEKFDDSYSKNEIPQEYVDPKQTQEDVLFKTNVEDGQNGNDESFRLKRSLQDFDEELLAELMFSNFLRRYQKQYSNKIEYVHRLKVFKYNLNKIHLLNKYEKGTARYEVNKYADLSEKEFSQMHGLRMDLRNDNDVPFPEAEIPDIDLPTSFDWREKNAVTEVKNQGMCGSCWAFSTTGNVEGQYAIKYNRLQEFSEQELVDCDKLDEGCNGGLMDNAYRTIEKLGGLESEKDYPYDGEDEKCHFNKSKVIVQLSGALNISTDETDMAKWLTKNGPISIAINANAMQFYAGGVSHPWKALCNPKELDHGVLIVGYGVHTTSITKKTLPYWIVKNSWGKSWGEQGYYRVYRGDGTCGLNLTPSSAIVA